MKCQRVLSELIGLFHSCFLILIKLRRQLCFRILGYGKTRNGRRESEHVESSLLWKQALKVYRVFFFFPQQRDHLLKSSPSAPLYTYQFQFYNTPCCASLGRKLAHLAESCMNNSFKCHADSQKPELLLWRKCLIGFFQTIQNIVLSSMSPIS